VKLQLNQQAVFSRDAFNATLQIDNSSGQPIQNVYVTLGVFDENGNDASALFGIQAPQFSNIAGTNGSGSLLTGQTGSVSWTLVPTADAAPTNTTHYFVSGGLNYIVGSNTVVIPLTPAEITVYPVPRLAVKYFHQRDVYADDPNTPQIEPSIPFSLGVMVQNNGYGAANDFRITSAQPQIVDNEKGLLINFKIIATEVAGQNLQPTLTADMGNIDPGTNAIAQWLMTATLQGLFINYSATFEHKDDFGNPRTSVIDDLSIHEMIHVVDAGGAFEDRRPDFLVNDIPDIHNFPDKLYLSDGSTNNVQVVTNDTVLGTLSPGNLHVQLNATTPGGWVYLNVPDPGNGMYTLVGIMRSDNTPIGLNTNAWVTDRTFIGLSKPPVRENMLHLLDYNSTGSYTLIYTPNAAADTTAPTSAVGALPAQSSTGIPLHWSGQDDLSGIATYDIYVSQNGGPFQQWISGTANTTAIYQGSLSNTYAFYSIGTDAAGNREAAPPTPDAVTTVTRTNRPPQIAAISNQTLLEGTTLSLSIFASDPDGDGLSFALGAGAPAGVVVNPQSGAISWVTGEGNGPSTNVLSVIVTDTGIPPLSATQAVQVIVLESNIAPVLAPIADVIISEGDLLTVTNSASDSDLPPQKLTFSLGAGAPSGMNIGPSSGILTWQPTNLQGGTTNVVSVVVTDDGPPPLSATQSFTVTVLNSQPDMVLSIGTTQLLARAISSVPLHLVTGADLTNLTLVLNMNSTQLNNLTLADFPAGVASAQILPVTPTQYQLQFQSQPTARLQGDFTMADLAFGTAANSNSAIVSLTGAAFTGRRASSPTPASGVVNGGRVFVVGTQPLLDATTDTNQQLALTIYGLAGKRYSLESLSGIKGTNIHSVVSVFNINNIKTSLPSLPMQKQTEFFRARLLPDSELLLGLQSGQLTINWPLECSNCVLQQSAQLGANAAWTPVVATPAVTNGQWQVNLPAVSAPKFYRLQLPP
jgi:hypothetical protein